MLFTREACQIFGPVLMCDIVESGRMFDILSRKVWVGTEGTRQSQQAWMHKGFRGLGLRAS